MALALLTERRHGRLVHSASPPLKPAIPWPTADKNMTANTRGRLVERAIAPDALLIVSAIILSKRSWRPSASLREIKLSSQKTIGTGGAETPPAPW